MGAAYQDLRCLFLHCEELAFDVMSWDSDLNKGRRSGFGCFQETRGLSLSGLKDHAPKTGR